jgi:hypothetical protein
MTDVCRADSDWHILHCIPGNNFVFVRLVFVFGIQTFLPSHGFIISVNRFSVKILRLWAIFCVKSNEITFVKMLHVPCYNFQKAGKYFSCR